MTYQPIEDYGVIGDLHTAALVGRDGSVDWLPFPRFDSPSVFAAILDDGKGGRFRLGPAEDRAATRQFYWPETNVLVTRFHAGDAILDLLDFMPVDDGRAGPEDGRLVRIARAVTGETRVRASCRPAFDYARGRHEVIAAPGAGGAVFRGPGLALRLSASVPLAGAGDGVEAEFALREGESAAFVLGRAAGEREDASEEAERAFGRTVAYWRRWLRGCTYRGRWREEVERSALALKLLTYEPTGAIVAAPTCGLPEVVGGERNWDYRYSWLRDAAFTVYALLRVGFREEAARFMDWLDARSHAEDGPSGPFHLVYRVDGSPCMPEEELGHLEGYRGSRPVRIGNGAVEQLQLDISGAILDAAYLYNKHAAPISAELWGHLRHALDWLVENWDREDQGNWEARCDPRHFVFSKLMAWVAFDRGLRLADKRSFPAPAERWRRERDRIWEQIMARGWDEGRGAFVQSYGVEALDASLLLMPMVFFVAPDDPRMRRTLDAILRTPAAGGLATGGLVYRYDPERASDGLQGKEGTFNLCTFWLVEALARAGRTEEARLHFEEALAYANGLGLYAEEIGPNGEALGNFPQAFTHLALISAAVNLDKALDGGRAGEG